jgi:membrane protein insertase Oxa1/YidC/SpoIIIJ
MVICLSYSSAFALYWVAGNLVSSVQTLLINKILDNKEKTAGNVAGEGSVK